MTHQAPVTGRAPAAASEDRRATPAGRKEEARHDSPIPAGGRAVELRGLTAAEAEARRKRGLANDMPVRTTRSYWRILRENAFTFINIVLVLLGVVLVAMGRPADVIMAVGIVVVNVLVSVLQEVKAKRKLDRIALLTRPTATVIRDGQERTVDPSQVVLGDVLVVRAGDQVVADGRVIGPGQAPGQAEALAEMDESLLTGESEAVPKRAGDRVFSGSFCTQGRIAYEAERVGKDSTASQLAATARAFRRVATPLQRHVGIVVRVMLLVAIFIELLIVSVTLVYDVPVVDSVRNSVVVVGLVPQGLFLAIAVAYALGAARMAGQAVLVQQFNAVESMSHVDILCLDKTGTLTSNRLQFHAAHGIEVPEAELRRLLGDFVASTEAPNRTSQALAGTFGGAAGHVTEEVPFSSDRKWSGLTLDGPEQQGTFILGAPEILRSHADGIASVASEASGSRAGLPAPHRVSLIAEWPGRTLDLPAWRDCAAAQRVQGTAPGRETVVPGSDAAWHRIAQEWASRGLRVLLFAAAGAPGSEGDHDGRGYAIRPLHDAEGQPRLPDRLRPLGLISFSDELRPEAAGALAHFRAAGIAVKIISGDSPQTVAALARQAGLGPDLKTVSGQELADMDAEPMAAAAEEATIFGRITPRQKCDLVRALKQRGHYVAMTGDGINDVLALKQADLGIAMESGSQATRAIADMVLMDDRFAALPAAFEQGQRIRNGMQDVLRLFLTRLLAAILLVGAIGFVGGFPFTPKQVTLAGLVTLTVPTIILAARAGPGTASIRDRMLAAFRFVLPAGLSLTLAALATYLVVLYLHSRVLMAQFPGMGHQAALDAAVPAAQTALAAILAFCGVLLVPFVVPPFTAFFGGSAPDAGKAPGTETDWRPTAVTLVLLAGYIVVVATPARAFFDLVPLNTLEYGLIAVEAAAWAVLMRWAWRSQVLERFVNGGEILTRGTI